MEENRKKPQVRFDGYTDDWEQRKVTELLKNTSDAIKIGPFGSALKKSFFTDKGIKVYAQENAFSGDFSIGNYYISEAKYNELKSCELKPGDLVISMMGTVGACAIFPENAEKGIMNSHLLRLQFSEEVLPEYIMFLLRDSQIIRGQIDRLSVGSIMTGLSSTVVKKLVFPVPKRPEQQKIVELLEQLDNLITLHQRKYNKLVDVKKSMLEKMFPKNGEKKPEIRFCGFTDDWEQRKLGDLVDVCSGRDYKHLSEGDIPVYGTGGYMLSVSEALSYDKDAIGIGRKGTIDKPYILNAPFWTVDTLFYAIPREKIDLNFAFDIFQNIDWKKKDESTGVPSLSKTAINEINVLVPQYDEQQALGEYFNGIDNLITLHQREVEKLKNIKKSMLEKMFI